MPCAPRSHLVFGDRDLWSAPRPTHPPPLQFSSDVNFTMYNRDFSSNVAKERLSHSLAFDSFVRKQASARESKKREKEKNAGWSFTGGSFATFELCCVRHCECYKDICKRKTEMVCLFLTLPACSHCDSAILSVSKRNWPQPPPSHIKPITFGNELPTYDMIPWRFRLDVLRQRVLRNASVL